MGDAVTWLRTWFSGWDFGDIKMLQFLLRQMPVALASILALEVGQLLAQRKRRLACWAKCRCPQSGPHTRHSSYWWLCSGFTRTGNSFTSSFRGHSVQAGNPN